MKASSDGSLEPQTNHLVVDQSEASGKQGTAAHSMVTTIAPIRLNLTLVLVLPLYLRHCALVAIQQELEVDLYQGEGGDGDLLF